MIEIKTSLHLLLVSKGLLGSLFGGHLLLDSNASGGDSSTADSGICLDTLVLFGDGSEFDDLSGLNDGEDITGDVVGGRSNDLFRAGLSSLDSSSLSGNDHQLRFVFLDTLDIGLKSGLGSVLSSVINSKSDVSGSGSNESGFLYAHGSRKKERGKREREVQRTNS